jgi:Patatin-like phospholipase
MQLNINAAPTLFRSYSVEGERITKCAIWQAARATTAAPTFFKAMSIEDTPHLPIAYVTDGGMGNNNPAQLALRESSRIWGRDGRVCLLSVGTGHSTAKSLPCTDSELEINVELQHSLFDEVKGFLSNAVSKIPYWDTASKIPVSALNLIKIANALKSVATDTESVHQHLFEEAEYTYPYFRFNVERDVGDIGLEEWKKLGILTAHTVAYMNSPERKRDKIECSKCLIDPAEYYSMHLQ